MDIQITKKEVNVTLTNARSGRFVTAKESKSCENSIVISIGVNGSKTASMILPKATANGLVSSYTDDFGSTTNERVEAGHNVFVRMDADIKRVVAESSSSDRYVAINKSSTQAGKIVLSIGDADGDKAAGFIMDETSLAEFFEAITTELS